MQGLSSLFKWTALTVAILYLLALGLWAIGTYGLFGQEQDPLSGILLNPLGMPWNQWFDDPEVMMAAPALNVVILWLISRLLAGKDRR